MEGLAEIVAFLAILVALTALWLVSDVVKKAEGRHKRIMDSRLKAMTRALEEAGQGLGAVAGEVADLKKEVKALARDRDESRRTIAALETRLADLQAVVDTIDGGAAGQRRHAPLSGRSVQ